MGCRNLGLRVELERGGPGKGGAWDVPLRNVDSKISKASSEALANVETS